MKKNKLLVPILVVAAFIGGYQFANRTPAAPIDTIRASSSTAVYTQRIEKATEYIPIVVKATATPKPKEEKKEYVLNTNTKKFHIPSCSSVKQMKEKNKKVVTKTRQEIIDDGYDPCGRCHP